MNISPLKTPKNIKIEDFGRFKKARELSGSNIFPTLLTTCIEQLIIKKCSNFAFEVFFGLMFEICEKLEISSLDTTKLGLAEFTCAMQSKRLKDFRDLQEKIEFYTMINEIGEYYDLNNDLKTLKSVQFSLANVKVNVLIRSEFYSRDSRRSESNYSTLNVLQRKDGLWLMLETEDFMDEEALEQKKKRKQEKFDKEKMIERQKMEKKMKEIEDQRIIEENLMRNDEKCRFHYLKMQKGVEKSVRDIISAADFYQKSINKDSNSGRVNLVERMVYKEAEMKNFSKEEKLLEIKQAEKMKVEEIDGKNFELKRIKKGKKIESFLGKSEKESKWARVKESELRICVSKVLENEEIRYKVGKDVEKVKKNAVWNGVGIEDRRGQKIWNEMKNYETQVISRMMIEENQICLFNQQEKSLNLRSKKTMECGENYIKDHVDNELTIRRLFQEKLFNEDQILINYLKKENKIKNLVKCSLKTSEKIHLAFDCKLKQLKEHNCSLIILNLNFTEISNISENQVRNLTKDNLDKESKIAKKFLNEEISINAIDLKKLENSEIFIKEHLKKEVKSCKKIANQMESEESLIFRYKKIEHNQELLNSQALSFQEKLYQSNSTLHSALKSNTISKMLAEEKNTRKFLQNQEKLTKSQKAFLTMEYNSQKIINFRQQENQKKTKDFLHKEKNQSKTLKKWEIDIKKSTINILLSEEKSVKLNFAKVSLTKRSIQKIQEKEEKFTRIFIRTEKELSENANESMIREERLSKKFEAYLLIQEKEQEVKKKVEDKYQEALRKIELQKIAEKQRQARQRQLRIEKDNLRRQSELRKKEELESIIEPHTSRIPAPDLESQISDDILVQESKIIESLSLICGSFFCTQCYRMLKRSSLFLKCNVCCNAAFKEQTTKNSTFTRPKLPENSLCVGCSNIILKGEIVTCICCYIKQDFLKDYSPPCLSCSKPDTVTWVDTYIGNKYELVSCGFCQRQVNYKYILEICPTCHDQICLHCLRKNNFLANSVCNECHSRRKVNPYRIV